MKPSRKLALCADDFGLSPGVCQGIEDLVQRGRLSAVTCLVGDADRAARAAGLAALPAVADGSVELGLHLNLTEGTPLSGALAAHWPRLPSLPRLILAAHLGRLPTQAIADELRAQFQAFVHAAGRAPDFLDGHQHVHHLPGIREELLAWLPQLGRPMPAVRATGVLPGPGFGLKRQLIALTGGRRLMDELARRGIRHNTSLFGVYDFAAPDYRALMRRWLAALPPTGALLFCHPGAGTPAPGDPIARARSRESSYLASPEFAQDLAAAGVHLGAAW